MVSITSSSDNIKIKDRITNTEIGKMAARMSRTATLDGGSVLVHSGVSHTDRTLSVRAYMTHSNEDALQSMFLSETDLRLACDEGFFSGAIYRLNRKYGYVEFEFWPTAKIA